MIFHRLAVSNFKGIRNIEIPFAPTGITLVEGRNEIGKSSLVQALTMLFDEPVSRTRAKLGNVIPKDGSGTPVIELEAESGGYRFVFRKSYIENKGVQLRIIRPTEETIQDKEAQERFEKILEETLDRTLWKALMLQQGTAVGLPEVENQQALMTALDNAVAGPGGKQDSESLYDRVAEEYGRYYHAGHGGELQTLRGLREEVEKAGDDVRATRALLNDLERKIVESRRLRQQVRSLRERKGVEERKLAESNALLIEAERLERAREAEQAKQKLAEEARTGARREFEDRRRLVDAAESAGESLVAAAGAAEAAQTAQAEAERAALEKRAVFDRCAEEGRRSEALAALRRADYEYYRDKLELERLQERRARLDHSRALVAVAKKEIAGNAVTDKAVKEIAGAENAVALARARMEGAAPRLHLEALGGCAIVMDGVREELAPGETRDMAVPAAASLSIPGVLRIDVTPGSGGGELEKGLRGAEERLAALLASCGVDDAASVPGMQEARRRAERVIEDHRRIEKDDLRDLAYSGGPGGLIERIEELEISVPAYLGDRAGETPISPDLDAAKIERDLAEKNHREATSLRAEAEAAWKAVEAVRGRAKDELIRLTAEQRGAERDAERARLLLTESREKIPDGALNEACDQAEKAFSDTSLTLAVLDADLRTKGPELLRERLNALAQAAAKTDREITEAREKLAGLEGELKLLGGNGLHEQLEERTSVLDHKTRLLNAELRRAEAAKLLYQIISDAREHSQQAYVQPLKRQIEDLARSVYSVAVQVALDKRLQISSRVMDGMDIAFAELSGGAREQFSLIHRAACSLVVSKDGGVPLILDDALGYSDAERLIGMNEVLSRAAQKCQVIILTCMPNRYAYLEPSTRINMEELKEKR